MNPSKGFSLVELLVSIAIAATLIAAISNVLNTALTTQVSVKNQQDTLQQTRFAMQRVSNSVRQSKQLLLPLTDNPNTNYSESVRNVLAVTLEPTLDNNKDGWADANNDKDFLDINYNGTRDSGEPELIDEDVGQDSTNDGVSGIIGIDDDNDGNIDEKNVKDNDEDLLKNEDAINGQDDDGDGSIDEDPDADMNLDGKSGIINVDDDRNGQVDEDQIDDDDEDGRTSEDWLDAHVFYLSGSNLIERMPNLLPATGKDYTEYPIAENVSQFRIEKIPANNTESTLVEITLTITPSKGEPVTLKTQVAIGSAL